MKKSNAKKFFKKIFIPHINYTVEIKDFKYFKENPNPNWLAVTQRFDKSKSIVYVQTPITKILIPTLCHELIHVLQNICESRTMDFTQEEEHTAYIFHYILNEILGNEYK